MAADLAMREDLFPVNRKCKVMPCPHCQARRQRWTWLFIIFMALVAAGMLALSVTPAAVNAAPAPVVQTATLTSYTGYVGDRILDLAETRANDWYVYGAAGPSVFDCSGLVDWAATAAGERNWPRDTYAIASQIGSRFSITSTPQRGDLAMWGPVGSPYHVELVTIWSQTTFGAEYPAWDGRVTWHNDAWSAPSFYLHINW